MLQQIREAMTPNPVTLPSTTSVQEAARIMQDADRGDVVVIKHHQVCGLVTDHDIVVRTVAEAHDPATMTLADLCSPPVLTVMATASVAQAVRLMRTLALHRVPVVEGGRVVGIVSLGDLAVEQELDAAPPYA